MPNKSLQRSAVQLVSHSSAYAVVLWPARSLNSAVRFLVYDKNMLDLKSPRWNELRHAYGNASDIPDLIETLRTQIPLSQQANCQNMREDPFFHFWSALCHQYDVYTASYAAVPHLLEIAKSRKGQDKLDCISFVSTVEACRHRKDAPEIPFDLEADYFSAIKRAERMTLDCLQEDWEELEYAELLGAFATLRGEYKLGVSITELREETQCPKCGEISTICRNYLFDNNEI